MRRSAAVIGISLGIAGFYVAAMYAAVCAFARSVDCDG